MAEIAGCDLFQELLLDGNVRQQAISSKGCAFGQIQIRL
jgi:hypothetical protein